MNLLAIVERERARALRLLRAGVPTELHVYPGAPHAFDAFPSAPISRRSRRDMRDWIRAAVS